MVKVDNGTRARGRRGSKRECLRQDRARTAKGKIEPETDARGGATPSSSYRRGRGEKAPYMTGDGVGGGCGRRSLQGVHPVLATGVLDTSVRSALATRASILVRNAREMQRQHSRDASVVAVLDRPAWTPRRGALRYFSIGEDRKFSGCIARRR